MADPLKNTAFSSISWTALSTFSRLGLQFAFSIILARLLSPADFGVMAIMMVVNAVAVCFIDSGFSQALIQKRNVTEVESNSVFLLGLATSLIMTAALVGSAPFLARFFDMPVLQPVAQVLSLNFVIVALGGVHSAMLTKSLQFKKLMKVNVGAMFIASALAVFAAARGWGVWSLVVHSLCASLLVTLGLWLWSGWRPGVSFSLASLKPLFRFGIFILSAGLLETVFGRINTLLIGRFHTADQLGYYSRGESTQHLTGHMLAGIVNQVAFPLFSAVSGDGARLLAGYKKAVKVSFYLQIPAMVGLFVTAGPVVRTLFGSKWEASIPYLELFALAGMLSLPRLVAVGLLNATGRSRVYFQAELYQKIAGVVGALATVGIGINAMLLSMVIVNTGSYLWAANVAARGIGYSCLHQLADSRKVFVAAGVMGLSSWGVGAIANLPQVSILPLQILVGVAVYLTMCAALGVAEQKEMLTYARDLMTRKFRSCN